ncbi:M23 family metallopeptidase [Georgenia alba]|uniref:M23 family metallopeptidase n=1 Tax=Georgenia alba TaxID=2233858 RepID=A0ABW2QAP7_9MICO
MPTRRQLREAERRRQGAEDSATTASASRDHAPAAGGAPEHHRRSQHVARLDVPRRSGAARAPRIADETSTEVLPAREAVPSRRSLRERHAPAPRRSRARAWAPRAALLGALGSLTIVAPLTGFAAPDREEANAEPAVRPVDTSVLEVLDSSTQEAAAAAAPTSLLADPAASTRATVLQTSRAADRQERTCDAVDGASGTRAAVTEEPPDLIRPVATGAYRNTSGYGYRHHPFGGYGFHTGTDFAAPMGTPIYAVADAVVDYVGYGKDGRSSMLVVLRHELDGETVYTWYVHMYDFGIFVHEGQEVSAGELIAEVGNNGNSTGPHLHFEVHTDDQGTTTEPLAWLEQHGAVDITELC